MTATQRKCAERWARTSLERLLIGWEGALISAINTVISADTRWRAREACTAARQMSWSASFGGSMVLNLEWGFDVALSPSSYKDGLARMQIDANEVTQHFCKHDEPGF